jgi:hypothetical protein
MISTISLTKGLITIVDADKYEELNSHKWYASGLDNRPARRLIEPERRLIYIYHHVLGVWPWLLSADKMVIDHINQDPLDNRLCNLRVVSQKENMRNATNYGRRQGVAYDGTHDRYKAYLDRPDLPRINIGTYKTEEEAKTALALKKQELGLENN